MILVTGASGNAGGAVLRAAVERGLAVRGMYRTAAEADAAPAGVEGVVADFADRASLLRALAGVEGAYVVCGPIAELVALEGNMITACRTAGVGHVVLNSALGAGRFGKSFPRLHAEVEGMLEGSGLAHTILRPNGFMQNIVAYDAASIRATGAFYAAMGEARVSMVDVRDVGGVAAAILGAPAGHVGRVYELNGPEAVSNDEVAARISRVSGRAVAFVDIDEAQQRAAMLGAGMSAWQAGAILELQEYYRSGACAGVDGVVAGLVGRPARTLDAYLEEVKAAFAAEGPPAA